MTGILAIWNDCAPEGEAHFERWYIREHLQERVGVPGFRFGRRYERLAGGDRRFFAFYEVERARCAELASAYVERLEDPTPWTAESMKYVPQHGAHRVRAARGGGRPHRLPRRRGARRRGHGAHGRGGAKLVARLAAEPGVARVQLWTAATKQTPADTAEMKKPGQGPARRRRLPRRVHPPRRRRSRRRDARAGRARRHRQGRRRRLRPALHLRARRLSRLRRRSLPAARG